LNSIVYYPDHNQFGRVINDTSDYIAINFDSEVIYFRRNEDWTEDQLKYLRENYKNTTNKALAKHLDFTCEEVEEKLKKENLKRRFQWNKQRDEILVKSQNMTNHELAEKLGTSIASIKGRLRRLRSKGVDIKFRKRSFTWTKTRDEILIKNHKKKSVNIAEMLNTSEDSVRERIRLLINQGFLTE